MPWEAQLSSVAGAGFAMLQKDMSEGRQVKAQQAAQEPG